MQINRKFVETLKIQPLNSAAVLTNALFPTSTNFIDVSRFERFTFLIMVGALTSALTMKVQQADAANGTPKDVTGATVTIAGDDDNKFFVIEVQTAKLDINNGYHFVTLNVAGVADADDYAAIAFFGYGDKMPVTQGSTFKEAVFIGG